MTSLNLPLILDNIDVVSRTNRSDEINDDEQQQKQQISKLFPKCRPKSDINLNPIIITTTTTSDNNKCVEIHHPISTKNIVMNTIQQEHENERWIIADDNNSRCCNNITIDNNLLTQQYLPLSTTTTTTTTAEEEEENDCCIIEKNNKPPPPPPLSSSGTYKLRDSRIIEIAGGRELYSQSRIKAVRKSRSNQYLLGINAGEINNEDGENKAQKLIAGVAAAATTTTTTTTMMKQHQGGVWELRTNNDAAAAAVVSSKNKQLLTKEYPETTVFPSSSSSSVVVAKESHISPTTTTIRTRTRTSPINNMSSYNTTINNSEEVDEVVVFDDIGDNNDDNNWKNDKEKEHEQYRHHHHQHHFYHHHHHPVVVVDDDDDDDDEQINNDDNHCTNNSTNTATSYHHYDTNNDKIIPKIIGNLPIAVYDGSPRRYGPRQHHYHTAVGTTAVGDGGTNNSNSISSTANHHHHHHQHHHQQQQHIQLPSAQSLLASPSVYPPRPGFPQRIVTSPIISPINDDECNVDNNSYNNNKRNISPPSANTTTTTTTTTGTGTGTSTSTTATTTFDYLYEFSETRKVLEEFFKCPPEEENNRLLLGSEFQDLEYELRRHQQHHHQDHHHHHHQHQASECSSSGNSYVGKRLAKCRGIDNNPEDTDDFACMRIDAQPAKCFTISNLNLHQEHDFPEHENNFLDLSIGTGSSGDLGETEVGLQVGHSRNFTLSPETTDCDSNCGDLDSEVSLMLMENELLQPSGSNTDLAAVSSSGGAGGDSLRLYSSMPVLEDGLSSGHASDTDNNNPTVMLMKRQITEIEREINQGSCKTIPVAAAAAAADSSGTIIKLDENGIISLSSSPQRESCLLNATSSVAASPTNNISNNYDETTLNLSQTDSIEKTPPPPAPAPHRMMMSAAEKANDVEAAIKDIRLTLQRTKILPLQRHPGDECEENGTTSPVWVPSHFRQRGLSSTSADSERKGNNSCPDDEENDTDLETDRLLGQQRTDDQGFYDEKDWRKPKSRTILPQLGHANSNNKLLLSSLEENNLSLPLVLPSSSLSLSLSSDNNNIIIENSTSSSPHSHSHSPPPPPQSPSAVSEKSPSSPQSQKGSVTSSSKTKKDKDKKKGRSKEVLIEGVLFRARYLGSTQLVCEGQPTKTTRMMQAEEAVSRIKALAPDGETQPSTEVDLFISTEKIMVLNTDLKEIMMDHALRTISYIADIGDLVVLMARRRFLPQHEVDEAPKLNRTPKMICHVFESEEAQFIAQSIGQAFQVAYMEFLKANGIEDHSFVKEMDYQEVLNSQEIFGDELQMFAKKEMQKEVVVPKAKGEILGVVIVESGWGSMLPTVVIANLAPAGAAARCGQLNIGDQIIAINGVSLVGLPLSTCQTYIKNSKTQTVVKLTVVPCAPVVEVKIKRPDTKYQLGFSVQNGVICSLLRGGIAERGGVRVGHRIIEINNQSVVAVPHEKIVNLLATSVGEILMKTMPTSMFRLLTGQENPLYI